MATPSESLKLDPPAIDPGTDIGHVHLKVADLDRALGFYQGVLGFELTGRLGDQAAFVSAGGYHHHIGLNTWESRGGSPPPHGTTGLYHVAIRYPTRPALARAFATVADARGRNPAGARALAFKHCIGRKRGAEHQKLDLIARYQGGIEKLGNAIKHGPRRITSSGRQLVVDVFAGRDLAQHQIGERAPGVYAYPDCAHGVARELLRPGE